MADDAEEHVGGASSAEAAPRNHGGASLRTGTSSTRSSLSFAADIVGGGVLDLSDARRQRPELFATEGLDRDAVHNTFLTRTRAWSGCWSPRTPRRSTCPTPRATRRSRTDRKRAKRSTSFDLAVPIVRGGDVLGVLTVQNNTKSTSDEDEVEVLQTTAMVVTEMITSGNCPGLRARCQARGARRSGMTGAVPSDTASRSAMSCCTNRAWSSRVRRRRPAKENHRLDAALESSAPPSTTAGARRCRRRGEHRDVLEAYRMFADEPWLVAPAHEERSPA